MYSFRSLLVVIRVRPVANCIIFIQINMVNTAVIGSQCRYHLILLFPAKLLFKKLLIGFFQLLTRSFLIKDLPLRAPVVTYQEYDH